MIVLHAVTRPLPRRTEVDGLSVLTRGAVSVLHTQTDTPPGRSRDALLEYGQRINALARQLPLLPMRYGTSVADADELDALVSDRAEGWARRLEVVAGHCELLVHVDPGEPEPSDGRPASGEEYLRRRVELVHQRDRAWELVDDAVRPWARELRPLPDGRRLAVLVRSDAAEFAFTAATALNSLDGLAVAVTGPWPVFSFCDEPAEA